MPLVGGRVGYFADAPQSHQLVGLYQGAPSAMQSGRGVLAKAAVVVAGTFVESEPGVDVPAPVPDPVLDAPVTAPLSS